MERKIHQGRNVKRLREILGIKQEALAVELGDDWNQRKVSLLEAKEVIDEGLLQEIAVVLKLPVEVIKNFDEEKAIFAIQNNYDNSIAHSNFQYQPNFNPLDKYVEAVEDFKRLNEDNRKLYLALLKEKDDKIAFLEKLVERK